MPKSRVQAVLEGKYPKEIVSHIVESFREVEQNYRLEKWKTSELDAGHFVEATRRLIEHELQGSFTPFSTALGAFSQHVLARYESCSGGEEYRILIPRVLYAMYCVRNKRGVGHIASVIPNKLDATFILHSSKWVLGELVRLASSAAPNEAKELVDQILYKQVDLIWDDGETFMVLDKKLKTADKALLVLYRQDRLTVDDLRSKIEYKNKTTFRRILHGLQTQTYLAITADGYCKLSPLGTQVVEQLILQT
jgi:hypothetical protein